jgi:GH25 family lysozyme M1 (1,4-beta-N-acetylmuramidase)
MGPRLPPGWDDWTIWQCSGDGGVLLPGGKGYVDVDLFRGTIDDLTALGVDPRSTLPTGVPAVPQDQGS